VTDNIATDFTDNGSNNGGNNNTSAKSLLIGRDKEVYQIVNDVKNNKSSSTWLLTGESGIGKSALLDEVYRRFTTKKENDDDDKDIQHNAFVGYYSRKESLIAESESLIYPFRIALKSLVYEIKNSQHLGERIDNTLSRVKKGFLNYATDQGKKIGLAILEDVAKKVGLEQTFEVGKDIVKAMGAEKTGMLLAQSYVSEHKDEARESYIEILKTLVDEFKERQFVLIFDQFEYVGKPSIDFFLNFAKFIMFEKRFHIIVSFRTDEITKQDSSTRSLFEELRDIMEAELHSNIIDLQGLSAEDIGNWIKITRGISLSLNPDLQRIKENSAGLPLLLEEWMRSSKDFKDYENINREQLCIQITKLKTGLSEDIQKNIYRLCILQQPFNDDEMLAEYLEMDDPYNVQSLVEKLIENRIFYTLKNKSMNNTYTDSWFRHELIKRCLEDNLLNSISKHYHDKAANSLLNYRKGKLKAH
jgi:predicted ATPase